MPRVLITGANGFIGQALCRRMIDEGWHVRGAIRSYDKKEKLFPGVESLEIRSIDGNTEWGSALTGIDTVVHLAARVHVMGESSEDPIAAYTKVNVEGTRHLAKAAAFHNVRRLVFVSSIKVNGEGKTDPYTAADSPAPIDPYAVSKFEAEKSLKRIAGDTGLEVVILRPPLVYGPGVKANFLELIKIIHRGIPLPLAAVKNRRSIIYLNNLTDAILRCANHPAAAGKTYLPSDGRDLSTPELIKKIALELGKPPRLFRVPLISLRLLAWITGRSATASRLLDSLRVDPSGIQSDLDWVPPFSVENGLAETVRWYLHSLR